MSAVPKLSPADGRCVTVHSPPAIFGSRGEAPAGVWGSAATAGSRGKARAGLKARRGLPSIAEPGFLPLAVGFALNNEFVGGVLKAVNGALGSNRVSHQGQPFLWLTV